jgi:diguanylate cyclase (GGDEF)-like protein/PAS domain S-box-containing protein
MTMSDNKKILTKDEMLELQINESRLKTAQALAGIGNWELDLVTNELYWSDEIFKIFEIDPKKFEPSYESFLNTIHPQDREKVNKAYLNSLETKQMYTIDHRLLMSDGSVKYVEEKCESYFNEDGKAVKSLGTVQDITELKSIELKLKKTLSFLGSYELAMNESSIVSKADLKGNITYVNDNFCKVSGYSRREAIGEPHNIVRHPDTPKSVFKDMWETIKAKRIWKGKLKNRGKLENYWVDITILPILDENRDIAEYIAVRHDITKMVKQQKKLDSIANTDILTGLGNRYKLTNDIKNSKRPALAILNIDNFALVNDFYGHETGDRIIVDYGAALCRIIEDENCSLYHLQGDEYVIFTQDSDKDSFIQKIYQIKNKISKITVSAGEEKLNFNFSIAVSFENKEKIFTTADMALKIAKRQNKDLVIYTEEISLNKEYENNIKWAGKIRDAIKNDNIVPVFQPIVNNQNGKWEKYESLVRIKDGENLVGPYFFLDISKKTKHYTQITKIMIEKSFLKFKDRSEEFSINLTIEDIINSDIQTYIFIMLERYKIGSRAVFEIVESESIENFEEVEDFIVQVKSYGCKVAIDDFGTGYSNFEYLMKLKADYIKIDGSMIKDIDTSLNAQIVVSTIVSFAKKMGIKTIAEFVENESILNKVKELGVDYSQGYYFSQPKRDIE